MKNEKLWIIVLVVLLAVGFAAVSTTLFINGTVLFGTKDDDFVVIFTKAIVDDVDLSDTAISEDGKTITYETKELAFIDEESILDFTVKNNSTQYDAEININCVGGANEGTYYELTYSLPTFVAAQSEIDGYVTARMIRSSVNEIIEELTCTLNVTAMERTSLVEETPLGPQTIITWSDEDSDGTKNIGDIITISKEGEITERFYILSSDETNTRMLSEFNLYVGGDASNETGSWVYTPYTNSTGIQNSDMLGYLVTDPIRRGTIPYATADQHGTNYTDYEGSVVEGCVNYYSAYLTNTFDIINSGTIITKEELEEIIGVTLVAGNNIKTLGAPEFLYATSYWTRTADTTTNVWYVNTVGNFLADVNYDYNRAFGVRPIITISTNLI